MVGGLGRYGNVRGGGFVELRPRDDDRPGETRVKQQGARPFFGKIVTAFKSLTSRTSSVDRQMNREVRKDFLDSLAQANRGVAAKYAERLIGDGRGSKPLSARLVRQILDEVDQAKQTWNTAARDRVGIPALRAELAQGRLDWMAEIARRFPERRDEFRDLLSDAVHTGMKTGGATRDEVIGAIARELHARFEAGGPLPVFVAGAGERPTVGEIEAALREHLTAFENGLRQFPVTDTPQVDPLVLVLHDPEARPERSILKQTGPVTPGEVPNRDIAEYTEFRSKAEDAILDGIDDPHRPLDIPGLGGPLPGIGEMVPQTFRDALALYNGSVGEDDRLELDVFVGHPKIDIYGKVFDRLEKAHGDSGDHGIPTRDTVLRALQNAVRSEMDGGLMKGLATHVLANPNLTPAQKTELVGQLLDRDCEFFRTVRNPLPSDVGRFVQAYLDR